MVADGDLVCRNCGGTLIAGYSELLRKCGPIPYFNQIAMTCPRCSALNTVAVKSDREASQIHPETGPICQTARSRAGRDQPLDQISPKILANSPPSNCWSIVK